MELGMGLMRSEAMTFFSFFIPDPLSIRAYLSMDLGLVPSSHARSQCGNTQKEGGNVDAIPRICLLWQD